MRWTQQQTVHEYSHPSRLNPVQEQAAQLAITQESEERERERERKWREGEQLLEEEKATSRYRQVCILAAAADGS